MLEGVLSRLNSDRMLGVASTISGPSALRHFFASCEEVQDVVFALRSGVILDESARAFVEEMLDDLKREVLFPHDLTFASLAVALETRYTAFAEEFLRWLAGMQSAEMPISPQVAREVLSHRQWNRAQGGWVDQRQPPADANVVTDHAGMSERFRTHASQQRTEPRG